MQQLENHKLQGGDLQVWQHESDSTQTPMKFAIYLPPNASIDKKLPVLYWLSGLTCTEQNFIQKSGFATFANRHNLIIIAPDTSPRGDNVADATQYDLGQGAGFYLNATQNPWAKNYQMYDYIVKELPALIEANFPANDSRSIFGHSMGGHGALMIALNNPDRYASVSAFSPIVAPSQVPWGQQAFKAYLGDDTTAWASYDTVEIIKQATHTKKLPILIDQGLADEFLVTQLKPELLEQAAATVNYPITLRCHEGYDHSYYFIASFIDEHIAFHGQALHMT